MNDNFDSNSGSSFEEMRDFLIGDEEPLERATEMPFSLEELQPVPYYKRPLIQMATVLGVGLPLVWLVTVAFKGGEQQVAKAAPVKVDAEKTQLIAALDAERERNRQLELEKAMYEQSIETIAPKGKGKAKPASQSKTKPTASPNTVPSPHAAKHVPQPTVASRRPQPAPRPPARRQVRTAPVARTPAPRPQTVRQPKPDPMQQWLAIANQGHYTTAYATEKPATPQLVLTQTTLIREPLSSTTKPPLLDDSVVKDALSNTDLLTNSELTARLDTSRLPKRSIVKKKQSRDSSRITPKVASRVESNTTTIDIGSEAKATLESAVVWSAGSSNPAERKYLLRLKDDFENIEGKSVLPEGTRLIAQVKQYSNSGLLAMEVTQILHEGRKISVPAGALVIEGKKGSPLKADLKQKGDSDFWADVASTVTPGIERVIDSASDTLVVQNGSVFRTNSRRDPLASGASGLADGINQTINRRLRNNQRESIVSYFQLDADQTVYLKAYEDIAF